jgi:hypothetical protein
VYLITSPGLLSLDTLKNWSPVDSLPLERPAKLVVRPDVTKRKNLR